MKRRSCFTSQSVDVTSQLLKYKNILGGTFTDGFNELDIESTGHEPVLAMPCNLIHLPGLQRI